MKQFENLSDLAGKSQKNEVFCAAVPDGLKKRTLKLLQFKEGSLPVRYLWVPLISSRLGKKKCKPLHDKSIIESWAARNLSFAGWLQLI